MDFLSRSTRRQLLQRFDGPCSALAINCCQFSCCIPRDALSDYTCDADDIDKSTTTSTNADWMKQVLAACPNMKLRDMVIPGTHDSGSYSIPAMTLFSAVGRTQNVSILQQLERGARYLDLRVGGSKRQHNDSSIWHGCLAGSSFELVVDQVATFLRQHPGEFVILEIVAEFGRPFSAAQKIQCLTVLQETLGDKIYRSPTDLRTLFSQTNLAEVVYQQKKQCLILLHGRFYDDLETTPVVNGGDNSTVYDEDYIERQHGFFRSDRWMYNRWYNTRNINQLLQWNLEEVKLHGPDPSRLCQNQWILTPGVGAPTDILHLLIGQLSLRPVSFALRLYQGNQLEEFAREHCHEPWNMIMVDFIDLVPSLVAFLISLNYNPHGTSSSSGGTNKKAGITTTTLAAAPAKLEIQLAAAHDGKKGSPSHNVTDKIRSLIQRECVLYVTNVAKDLALPFSNGQVTLVYQFVPADAASAAALSWQVKQINFDSNTHILLGSHAQNPGPVVAIENDKNVSSDDSNSNNIDDGVIFCGQRHSSSDKAPTNCCVIHYRGGSAPEFSLLN